MVRRWIIDQITKKIWESKIVWMKNRKFFFNMTDGFRTSLNSKTSFFTFQFN